jgi:hypothetical protein
VCGLINRSPTRAAALLATMSFVLEKSQELANADLDPSFGLDLGFSDDCSLCGMLVRFLTIEYGRKRNVVGGFSADGSEKDCLFRRQVTVTF